MLVIWVGENMLLVDGDVDMIRLVGEWLVVDKVVDGVIDFV